METETDDFLNQLANNDQATAALKVMAFMVVQHYKSLLGDGLPRDLVCDLTICFQTSLLELACGKAGERHD